MMQGVFNELELRGVYDRGVPNVERVVIRVVEHVDMASYVLFQGVPSPGGGVVPIQDSMFWFGNGFLSPDDWIFVYTGMGSARTYPVDGRPDSKLVQVFWNRSQTLFHAPMVVPVLARMDAVVAGEPAPVAPQPGIGMLGAARTEALKF